LAVGCVPAVDNERVWSLPNGLVLARRDLHRTRARGVAALARNEEDARRVPKRDIDPKHLLVERAHLDLPDAALRSRANVHVVPRTIYLPAIFRKMGRRPPGAQPRKAAARASSSALVTQLAVAVLDPSFYR
jgi:hypothetical protein